MKVSEAAVDAEQDLNVRVSDIVETCGRSLSDLQVYYYWFLRATTAVDEDNS